MIPDLCGKRVKKGGKERAPKEKKKKEKGTGVPSLVPCFVPKKKRKRELEKGREKKGPWNIWGQFAAPSKRREERGQRKGGEKRENDYFDTAFPDQLAKKEGRVSKKKERG